MTTLAIKQDLLRSGMKETKPPLGPSQRWFDSDGTLQCLLKAGGWNLDEEHTDVFSTKYLSVAHRLIITLMHRNLADMEMIRRSRLGPSNGTG